MSEPTEGWGFPGTSRKAHYFRDTRSLCRRWGFYRGNLESEKPGKPSPDDCTTCRKALDKEPQP
jgi:hypothetical protein